MRKTVSQTRRKTVTKELREFLGAFKGKTITTREEMNKVAQRHGVPLSDVESIATELGYSISGFVQGAQGARPVGDGVEAPRAPTGTHAPRVTAHVREQIMQGRIFRALPLDNRGDDTPVVTTLGALRREREAIIQWVRDAADGFDTGLEPEEPKKKR